MCTIVLYTLRVNGQPLLPSAMSSIIGELSKLLVSTLTYLHESTFLKYSDYNYCLVQFSSSQLTQHCSRILSRLLSLLLIPPPVRDWTLSSARAANRCCISVHTCFFSAETSPLIATRSLRCLCDSLTGITGGMTGKGYPWAAALLPPPDAIHC